MASLYKRKGSPFFWLQYVGADGKRKCVSTRCRIDVAPEIRRARQIAAQKTVEELRDPRPTQRDGWEWVQEFLQIRYGSSPSTMERYSNCWFSLKLFIDQHKIFPANLSRQHCFDFITWRTNNRRGNDGRYTAGQNTALLDLKILRIIMQEAVVRGIITGNPCVKLGIKRARPKREKPELTEKDCETIRSEAAKVKDIAVRDFLLRSFDIARHQGCRLQETKLNPCTDVDLANQTIRFRNAKGGKDFCTRLHPALIPLFEQLQKEGCTTTWEPPPTARRQWPSIIWWKFLNRIGLKSKGVTFHSTRVTVVTELARNNVHESKAQVFVGHASTLVHRVYQRLRATDLDDCTNAVARR